MLNGHAFIGGFSQESSKMIGAVKKLRISAYISATFLLLFFGLAVFPVASSVSDTNAAKKSLDQTTISMTASNFYTHPKVTSVNGSFSSSSTNITVSTDNYTGYTLALAAGNNDEDYSKLKTDSEDVLNSITSATSEADFSAASGTALNGYWGYKPSMFGSAANVNFLPAPSFAGDVLNVTNSANAEADTYSVALGARADSSTPAGRYRNAFIVRLVANPIGLAVTYHENTEDDVTGMPENTASTISDEYIEVANETPAREGYEFTHWCDVATRTVLGVDYCDSESYNGGDYYYFDRSESSASIDFYAMWKPAGADDFVCNENATSIDNAICMQDMNNAVAASMTVEQQYQLLDSRDGKKYYISKLADGHVWMTQNLNHVLDNNIALTHANTDLGWAEYDENATWTPVNSTVSDSNNWISDNYTPSSFKDGSLYIVPSGTNDTDKKFTTLNECAEDTGSKTDCAHREAGVIYNWSAAVAEDDTNKDEYKTATTIVNNSVCPAGWRLPYGVRVGHGAEESSPDYNRLAYAYEIVNAHAANASGLQDSKIAEFGNDPTYLARFGYIYNVQDGLKYIGQNGRYWTGTSMGESYAGYMNIWANDSNQNSAGISFVSGDGRYNGYSVRCVARNTSEITFDANGGDGTMASITMRGDTYLPENQFTKSDKSFTGWNTERDGSGDAYGAEYNKTMYFPLRDIDGDITLYAQWDDKVEISYEGNGADSGSVETQYVDYGADVVISNNGFVRDGYNFTGWNTEPDGSGDSYNVGDIYNVGFSGEQDLALYAMWYEAVEHTVNYEYGDSTNTVVYTCSSRPYPMTKISHTQNVDDTGYKRSNYGGNWNESNIVGSDRGDTSKAHVVTIPGADTINIDIYYNGQGTSYDWASVWSGSHPDYTAYSNYSSTGRIASYNKFGDSFSYSNSYVVNGNTLNYMGRTQTSVNDESVTFGFYSNGSGYGSGYGYYAIVTGNAVDFKCIPKSGEYSTPSDLANSGFLGWNSNSTSKTPAYYSEDDVIQNYVWGRVKSSQTSSTVYGVYGMNTTISFDANEGTGVMEQQAIPYTKSAPIAKNEFVREGYGFANWNTAPDGSGVYYEDEEVLNATNSNGESITLYAQWTLRAEYTVNYHNGEDINTVKYKCWDGSFENTKISHSPNVSDDGTMISSLDSSKSYSNTASVITMPGATKLHVKLMYGTASTANGWVTMWAGNHPDYYAWQYDKSDVIKLGDNVTGYYGGMDTGNQPFVVEGDVDGDTISVALYSYRSTGYGYYLEVTRAEDTMLCESEPIEGEYSEAIGDANDVFLGWSYTEGDLTTTYMDEAAVKASLSTEDTTVDVYSTWAKPTIIRYNNNGGNGEMDDVVIKYGNAGTVAANSFTYDDEDTSFYRWNTAADNTGSTYNANNTINATNPVGGVITLYAIWAKPTIYHFDANGGEGEIADLKVPYNTSYTKVPRFNIFTKENANQYRWTTNQDGSGSSYYENNTLSNYNISGGEVTLYAQWGNDMIIHFDANGGEGEMNDFHAAYYKSSYLPAVKYGKVDADFVNWSTEPDGTGSIYSDKGYYYNGNVNGGEMTLYAVWRDYSNVVYDGNGADSGTMTNDKVGYNKSVMLKDNEYEKNGYTFVTWATATDGTGDYYNEGSTYTSNVSDSSDITLYAIWKPDYAPDMNYDADGNPHVDGEGGAEGMTLARSYELAYVAMDKGMYVPVKDGEGGYDTHNFKVAESGDDYSGIPANEYRFAMQDMTTAICEKANVIPSSVLTVDLRDNKSYWVTKLVDGKCWMTQNLDFDLEGGAVLEHSKSDIGWTSGDSTATWTVPAEASIVSVGNDKMSSGWEDNFTEPRSADPGEKYLINPNDYSPDVEYSTLAACVSGANITEQECMHHSVGNYYNWTAAIATTDSTTLNSSAYNTAPDSICPAGWRLPVGKSSTSYSSTTTEFANLLYQQGIITKMNNDVTVYNPKFSAVGSSPLYFARSGDLLKRDGNSTDLITYGVAAWYWSSSTLGPTQYSTMAAAALIITNSGQEAGSYYNYGYIWPADSGATDIGSSVRCVAR